MAAAGLGANAAAHCDGREIGLTLVGLRAKCFDVCERWCRRLSKGRRTRRAGGGVCHVNCRQLRNSL